MDDPRLTSRQHDPDAPWPDLEAWVLLTMVPGVGPLLHRDLLARFGTAEAVFRAAPDELREIPRLGPKLCQAIATARDTLDVRAEMDRCRQHGIELIPWGAKSYPLALRQIPDPPVLLYARGPFLPQDQLAVAIVGTRHATSYGRRQARQLASGLARAGVTVVSGLARGIDAEAHRAALAVDGRTIAVLGGGLLDVYPREHGELADQISQHGVVLSELPSRTHPSRGAFPRRNRIITGICQGVIVVEAASRSGALISARLAVEQNREVFAVPGPVDSRTSRGCHQLLRDGAKLVETVADVLEELGPLPREAADAQAWNIHWPAELLLNDAEKQVLAAVDNEPTTIDRVTERSGIPVHRVLSTISVLEMRRVIRRISGTQVARV